MGHRIDRRAALGISREEGADEGPQRLGEVGGEGRKDPAHYLEDQSLQVGSVEGALECAVLFFRVLFACAFRRGLAGEGAFGFASVCVCACARA